MNAFLDFIRAAAPWVAMGLLVIIFCVRGAAKNKNEKKQDGDYGTEGMCLGMCFGTALGTALGNNTGIGISLGMLIGLAVGMCVPRKSNEESSPIAAHPTVGLFSIHSAQKQRSKRITRITQKIETNSQFSCNWSWKGNRHHAGTTLQAAVRAVLPWEHPHICPCNLCGTGKRKPEPDSLMDHRTAH